MSEEPDPFERAVAREQSLRERAAAYSDPAAFMKTAWRWLALLGVGWAAVLGAQWAVFPDPRWLAVGHSVVFALVTGYWLVGAAFLAQMKRRRPDVFGE